MKVMIDQADRSLLPNASLVNEQVDELQIPGADGYLGVLPGHAPLFSELKVGELSYRKGNTLDFARRGLGFCRSASRSSSCPGRNCRTRAGNRPRTRNASQRTRGATLDKGGDDVDYDRASHCAGTRLDPHSGRTEAAVGILRSQNYLRAHPQPLTREVGRVAA